MKNLSRFNRMWVDNAPAWPVKPLDYVPSHEREGFDESKVIKLDYKGVAKDEQSFELGTKDQE